MRVMSILLALLLSLPAAEPPLPDRPDHGSAEEPVADAPAEEGTAPKFARARSGPGQVTLLGAGALGPGGAAWLTQVGYPYLAVGYAQGVTSVDDLGASVSYAWTTSEMLLAATWRRELAAGGAGRLGTRLAFGPWIDFGSNGIYGGNKTNGGPEAVPGIAWTPGVGPGLATLALDLGLFWTLERGMGLAAEPALSLAYEVPVARDLGVGARAYLGTRWGSGSAGIPGLDGHLNGGLTVCITWRMF